MTDMTATTTPATPATLSPSRLIVGTGSLGATAGRLVTWRTGGSVKIEELEDAVRLAFRLPADHSFERGDLPRRPSVRDALKRLANSQAYGRNKRVHVDPKGGYCVVRKRVSEEDELDFRQTIRLDYDMDSGRPFQDFGSGPEFSDTLTRDFERIRNEYIARDFQRWIPHLMVDTLHGVNCRDGGGVVFVPADSVGVLDTWNRILRENTGCKIYSNPAGRGGDFLEMAMDGIAAEATQALKESEARDGAGKRALATADAAVDAIARKLSRYEKILDRKLPELTGLASEAKRKVAIRLLEEGDEG